MPDYVTHIINSNKSNPETFQKLKKAARESIAPSIDWAVLDYSNYTAAYREAISYFYQRSYIEKTHFVIRAILGIFSIFLIQFLSVVRRAMFWFKAHKLRL